MSVQELLKLLFTYDEPLSLPQSLFPCILAINQQTLEHLNTQIHTVSVVRMRAQKPDKHFLALPYLPADRVQLDNVFRHVFVHVEGVDDRVDLEGHFVLLAPLADFVEAIQVALPALSSADQLVGIFVETIARDGQYVQIITWWGKLAIMKFQ